MRILITGVSTRAIAESARAAGYDFITLDYFGDYDQRRICENHSLKRDFGLPFGSAELYRASRRLNFDAIAYTSDLENHPEVVEKFAAGTAAHDGALLLGNSAAVLARVRHWPTVFGFLQRQGIPTPETIYPGLPSPPNPLSPSLERGGEEGEAARPPLPQRGRGGKGGEGSSPRRWLRKPVRSGGGHRIAFWPLSRRPGKGFLLQEYIQGTACSASFVANGRECVVLGLTEQLIGRREFGARGFHYCGNILPLALPPQPSPTRGEGEDLLAQVRQIATGLTREFGLVGVNGLDFVLNDGQVVPLEVNPRYSASMELIEWAYGLSIFDLHVRAIMQGDLPEFDLATAALTPAPLSQTGLGLLKPGFSRPTGGRGAGGGGRFYGKAILYAERDGRAPDTEDWPERGIRDVPFPGESLTQGKPVCTVLASEPTRDACFASLVAQAQALTGEIYA